MEDAEAIRRLQQGDIRGLEGLVRRYYVAAVRAAILVTRDRALAEDVVQSAFLRAYERIGQFDASRPFAPWFLRLAVNAAVDAAKRHRRELSLDALQSAEVSTEAGGELQLDRWLADPNPGPEEMEGQAEMQEMVRMALERLSPEQRAVIVLRYYLAYSEAEMAQALGSPPGTIKSRLSAARARLRGWLAHLRPAVPLAPANEPLQAETNPSHGGGSCVAKR